MIHMQDSKDNQNDFSVIHIRPGLQGKSQPVGSVAVNLRDTEFGHLTVGYSIQHSKLDAWDGARGRAVAIGRAARGRDTCLVGRVDMNVRRRELLIAALELVEMMLATDETLSASRNFRRALSDTLIRMQGAKADADRKLAERTAE